MLSTNIDSDNRNNKLILAIQCIIVAVIVVVCALQLFFYLEYAAFICQPLGVILMALQVIRFAKTNKTVTIISAVSGAVILICFAALVIHHLVH